MGARIQQIGIWKWRPSIISLAISLMITLFFAIICCTVFISLLHTLQNSDFNWQSVVNPWIYSFKIAVLTCSICLALALIITWCFWHLNLSLKSIDQILALPYCLPTVAVGGMIILTYGNAGLLNQLLARLKIDPLSILYRDSSPLIGTVWMNLSLGVLLLLRAWHGIPKIQWQQAELMQFTRGMRLRYIVAPALRKALFPWLSVTFLACFNSFGLMLILSGSPSATTLELATWQSLFMEGDWNRAAVLMTVQAISSALLIAVFWSLSRSQLQETILNETDPYRSSRTRSFDIFAWMGIVSFFIFYLLPIVALLLDVTRYFQSGRIEFSEELGHSLLRSAINAAVVGVLSILIVAIIIPALQKAIGFNRTGFKRWFSMVIGLPGIIPGMVSAFAILALLVNLETDNYNVPAIWLIQSIMAIPITAGIYWSGWKGHLSKHFRIKEELGLTSSLVWRKIEFPIMWKWAATSGVVAAGLSIGDTTIVSLLSNRGDPPLTILIARLMGTYQFAEASLIILVLVVLTVILFLSTSYRIKGMARD